MDHHHHRGIPDSLRDIFSKSFSSSTSRKRKRQEQELDALLYGHVDAGEGAYQQPLAAASLPVEPAVLNTDIVAYSSSSSSDVPTSPAPRMAMAGSSTPMTAVPHQNSNSLANPNLVVQTQWVGTQLRQPLDTSIVTSIVDKQRIERVDTLFCSMSDDMPLLTKNKVKLVLQSYYSVLYDWDDSVYTLPAFELVRRFNLDFVRDINIGKQGIIFYIWTEAELEKQGIGLHRNKRARLDMPGSAD